MTIKMHVFPLSPRAFKVLFAANHLGIEYEMAFVDFTKQDQKTPGFTALNPNQRMPVLEDDGFVLWEAMLDVLGPKPKPQMEANATELISEPAIIAPNAQPTPIISANAALMPRKIVTAEGHR